MKIVVKKLKKDWQSCPAKYQPIYENQAELELVESELKTSKALVKLEEIEQLNRSLAKVCMGKGFLLQGGDCAESFAEFSEENIKSYLRTILQMTVIMMYGAGVPIVKVGRICGQFAKPRTSSLENRNGVELPSFLGDIINGLEFSEDSRKSDPKRMLQAYEQSVATLKYIRELIRGGYSSLANINEWNESFLSQTDQRKHFQEVANAVKDSLNFIEACGLSISDTSQFHDAEFYISHEGLLLNYEEALTREESGVCFAGSAHMLWIGDKTRELENAHVEYMKGICNPIGIKIGKTTNIGELIQIINVLNPDNIPGKITLISRMGADFVSEFLPPIIKAVMDAQLNVIWSCDPMHGNTIKANNIKTRHLSQILLEIKRFFEVHNRMGTYAGGIHFEMTGQDVTECININQTIADVDLEANYSTHCDPRLNSSQSLELAFLVAEELRKRR